MSSRNNSNIFAALDIGTSKVALLVGEKKDNGRLHIKHSIKEPSQGIKNGNVVDMQSTKKVIQMAIKDAEFVIGDTIQSVHVGITGSHIACRNTEGLINIPSAQISKHDVNRILENATPKIPNDQHLLHLMPQEYIIDDHQMSIIDPVGMAAGRLKLKALMITCSSSALQNLKQCISECNIDIASFILQPLASSISVLEKDEKDLGVAVVDIGAGTTDITFYLDGTIRHVAVIPIAGANVNKQIIQFIKTPLAHAEQIKIKHGRIDPHTDRLSSTEAQQISVPSVGGRPHQVLSSEVLSQIIEKGYEQIFKEVQLAIQESGYERLLGAGIVLTGGGSNIAGINEFAEETLDMPSRIGIPKEDTNDPTILTPDYATGIGLLKYPLAQYSPQKPKRKTPAFSIPDAWRAMSNGWKKNF